MTDKEINEYMHNHRSTTMENLKKEVIDTSPQITGVYHEWIYDLVTIVTPDNQFIFFV